MSHVINWDKPLEMVDFKFMPKFATMEQQVRWTNGRASYEPNGRWETETWVGNVGLVSVSSYAGGQVTRTAIGKIDYKDFVSQKVTWDNWTVDHDMAYGDEINVGKNLDLAKRITEELTQLYIEHAQLADDDCAWN